MIGHKSRQRASCPGRDGQNVAHEKLAAQITITDPGYVYIYLSNEEMTPVEVYFDDFKVTYTKSPVVQSQDYYPFGLTFDSYARENVTPDKYQYNGKELQDELSIGWLDYDARMYDVMLGRWLVPDLLSEFEFRLTPYRYCYNNPVSFSDPFGLWEKDANGNYSTNNEKDINRFLSYLQAENAMQKKSANISQINSFIGEEKSGGLGTLSDGSKLVSDVSVKGYVNSVVGIDWYTNKANWQMHGMKYRGN